MTVKKLCPALEAHEAAALRPANDSVALTARLTDFATRGSAAPETLTPYEIEQISFALLVGLVLEDKKFIDE
jgi:hypothetical protein